MRSLLTLGSPGPSAYPAMYGIQRETDKNNLEIRFNYVRSCLSIRSFNKSMVSLGLYTMFKFFFPNIDVDLCKFIKHIY